MDNAQFNSADHRFMAEALRLAERGLYSTTPNPRVGCVLVKEGKIVASGWHVATGEAHAETIALQAAGKQAKGSTAYVNLEPCNHIGNTPPCSEALINAGVARVVAAMADPNPLTAGQGLVRLQDAGIEVGCGLMADEARELNRGFISRMTRQRPWLRLKIAASLDGKTALSNGQSQWITGPKARSDNQGWRARSCAILSGSGTIRHDDPQLNVREIDCSRQPLRVLVDSNLQINPEARVLQTAHKHPLLIACSNEDPVRTSKLRKLGAQILCLPDQQGRVDLAALMQELAQRGINELQVEAGASLNGSLLAANLVDEFLLYLAPCLLGEQAAGMFAIPPLQSLSQRSSLRIIDTRLLGDDLQIVARPAQCAGNDGTSP